MRDLRKTKGELLRDRLEGLLSMAGSSCLSLLEEDLPRSLSELGSLEGKIAPIMDLTDILRGLAGSGGVGVFGGEGGGGGGTWCGWVSVHAVDLRKKKDLESEPRELKVLPELPGLGP